LEEVAEPVFVRGEGIRVPLDTHELGAVNDIAKAKGIPPSELIRQWVVEKIS